MIQDVFLATPCYGQQVTMQYANSLVSLVEDFRARGVSLRRHLSSGDALITRARNNLVNQFLRTGCSHLLFIDSDMEFRPEVVARLLDAGKDIVGAVYPLKRFYIEQLPVDRPATVADLMGYVVHELPGGGLRVQGGFAEVAAVGGGMMLIRRDVIERLVEHNPQLRYRIKPDLLGAAAPVGYALFDTMIDPDTLESLPEDYAFCRRARMAGFRVWADVESQVNHVGTTTFPGNFQANLRTAER